MVRLSVVDRLTWLLVTVTVTIVAQRVSLALTSIHDRLLDFRRGKRLFNAEIGQKLLFIGDVT